MGYLPGCGVAHERCSEQVVNRQGATAAKRNYLRSWRSWRLGGSPLHWILHLLTGYQAVTPTVPFPCEEVLEGSKPAQAVLDEVGEKRRRILVGLVQDLATHAPQRKSECEENVRRGQVGAAMVLLEIVSPRIEPIGRHAL